jgi:DNA-binding NarL/FixJ family response regulator
MALDAPAPDDALRVALFEDDGRYRRTLETFLHHARGLRCVASFGGLHEGLAAAPRAIAGWDVVLMDLQLGDASGLDGIRALKRLRPELAVVVLTAFENPGTILDAISAGANGYVLKRASVAELGAAIRAASEGGAPLTPLVAARILETLRGDGGSRPPAPVGLTERERDVLRELSGGASYQGTADALGMSLDTVRTHIRSIYRKLEVRSAPQAVARALRDRLV